MMANPHKFAPGHNNVAGLQGLHEISPPLFGLYKLDIRTEWHPCAEYRMSGALGRVKIGLPYVIFLFDVLDDDEMQLLLDTYCGGLAQDGNVTIQTLNKELAANLKYNGVMRIDMNETEHRLGHWANVRVEVTELQLISAFSNGFDILAFGA